MSPTRTSAHKGAINWVIVVIFAALFLFVILLVFAPQVWGPAADIRNWWKLKL